MDVNENSFVIGNAVFGEAAVKGWGWFQRIIIEGLATVILAPQVGASVTSAAIAFIEVIRRSVRMASDGHSGAPPFSA